MTKISSNLLFQSLMQKIISVLLMSGCFFAPVLSALEMPANVSLDEAVKRINAEKTGKVLATKVETVDGQKFYVIKILTAEGIIQYLKIDVASGKVVE